MGTRSLSQVYCRLQNMKSRNIGDCPEIRRILRESWRAYCAFKDRKVPQYERIKRGPQAALAELNRQGPIVKQKRSRKLWNR